MRNDRKIRINFDNVTQLIKIPQIGEKLAERIIWMREKGQYFRSPEDLSKIRGISLKAAQQLQDVIDWSTPLPEKSWEPKSDVIIAGIGIIVFAFIWMIYGGIKTIPSLIFVLEFSSPNLLAKVMNYGRYIFLLLNQGILIMAFLSLIFEFLVAYYQNKMTARNLVEKIEKYIIVVLIALGFLAISLVFDIAHVVFYLLDFSVKDPFSQNIVRLIFQKSLSIVVGVYIWVIFWHPQKILRSTFLYLGDSMLFLTMASIGYPIMNEVRTGSYDIFFLIISFLMILAISYFNIKSLRSGRSFFEFFYRYGIERILFDTNTPSEFWLEWLNRRLPHEEQKKALRDALNTAYPPSRIKTLINWLFFVFGGWLLVSIGQSILDYFVQNLLRQIFP